MPRRIYTYNDDLGWEWMNLFSAIGGFIIAIGTLIFLYNAARTLRKPATAEDNPWDAYTLEWLTSSPPPVYNFEQIPVVNSRHPAWDLKHPESSSDKPEEQA